MTDYTSDMRYADIISQLEELKALLGCTKEILDVSEASAYTGIAKSTLYKMCSEASIPHYKSKGGKKVYFKRCELTEWMLHTRVSTRKETDSRAAGIAYL